VTTEHPIGAGSLGPDIRLVLGGGHALGAYLAGAYEQMHASGLRPGRIVGSSTGAVIGAILAGNPPEWLWSSSANTGTRPPKLVLGRRR
jgi:predicted acylesterase/phospholipase RssA